MTLQLDLFGEVERAEQDAVVADAARRHDALTCLTEAHPDTLNLLLGNRRLDTGEIKQGCSGNWAYSVRSTGFWFQDRATWGATAGAWYRKPVHHFAWAELDAIAAADPRVDEIRAWADSLTAIDRWKDLTRPFELWPNPERWHPSYIKSDHTRPGWDARIHTWHLALTVLTDARQEIA